MTKKKVTKKASNKSLKNKLDQQVIKPGSYDYYQAKANNLIADAWVAENLSEEKLEQIAKILKNESISIYDPAWLIGTPECIAREKKDKLKKEIVDGYAPEVKTTTFTSTTFDDIVAFPKYPVNKTGFHIVGKTNDVDLNEQIIKSFEPNDNLKVLLEKEFAKPAELFNYLYEDDELIFEAAEKLLTDIENRENIKEKLNSLKNIHNNSLKNIHNNDKAKFKRFEPIVSKTQLKELNVNHNENQPTNRDKINSSNELFEKLAEKAGQITKEYWKAKHKLIMMNKFMEDFYNEKKFDEINPIKILSFDEELNIAVDFIDGEDSKYKKSILRKVRPDKYK